MTFTGCPTEAEASAVEVALTNRTHAQAPSGIGKAELIAQFCS